MITKQTTLDFTHAIENNPESDANYTANLDRFNNQCRIVLEQLLTGRRLTVREAYINLDIGHLPRRIADLKEAGIPVLDEFPENKDGTKKRFKEYWLEKSFINRFLT